MKEEENTSDLQGNVRKESENRDSNLFVYMYACMLSNIHIYAYVGTYIHTYHTTKWNHHAHIFCNLI